MTSYWYYPPVLIRCKECIWRRGSVSVTGHPKSVFWSRIQTEPRGGSVPDVRQGTLRKCGGGK